MLSYILFIVIAALLCYTVTKLSFVKKAGLSNTWIVSLFSIKLLAGVAIGYCSLNFYGIHNDYWDNNLGSMQEYEVLKTNPKYFFSELFVSNYNASYSDFWGHADSFWNDLKNNCLIKFMAIFNFISQGNYYINSIFFNSIVFLGHIGLYRLFKKMFTSFNYGIIIGCFVLPSFLYFSSGIHRDGLIFTLITSCLYCTYSILQERKQNFKYYFVGVLSILLLLILRNIVAITLLPILAAWWVSTKFSVKPIYAVSALVILFLLAILFTGKISSINPLQFIAAKQADYFKLDAGNTKTSLQILEPTATSFLSNTPTALGNIFLKPFLWQKPITLLPFAVELIAYYIFIIAFLCKKVWHNLPIPTIYWAVIIGFIFLSFLFIGHIIPNLGAIIRYRSIYLPFILTPVLASLYLSHYKKLKNKII
jgi:hypothetical protein